MNMDKESIGKMIKITNQIFETYINNSLKKINLTNSQMGILIYLCDNYLNKNEIYQIDIQNRFKLSNPTVSGILDRLMDKGFIMRINNGRSNKIIPTDKGIELIDKSYQKFLLIEDRMVNVLSLDEKEELKRILGKIINNNKIGDGINDKEIG